MPDLDTNADDIGYLTGRLAATLAAHATAAYRTHTDA
jgi:hypothetical protein